LQERRPQTARRWPARSPNLPAVEHWTDPQRRKRQRGLHGAVSRRFPARPYSGLIPTLAAVKDAAVAARKGEGNLRYDVEQEGVGLGNHMIFYAAWQNRDDFDAYEKSDYARHLRDVVGPLLGSPYDDRLYALLD
jgi:quinol monooxygenase YgiN